MFNFFISAAMNTLSRNRLHSAVTIAGLALGFAVAILTGLVVRNELRFDRFLPNAAETYLVVSGIDAPGRPRDSYGVMPLTAGDWLPEVRGISMTARLQTRWTSVTAVDATSLPAAHFAFPTREEQLAFADPLIFDLLPLPVMAGDISMARASQNGVVITQAVAERYFHHAAPIGRMLTVRLTDDDAPPLKLTVVAVLRDLPPETHLAASIFVTGPAAQAAFARYRARAWCPACIGDGAYTYVRLNAGVSTADVEVTLATRFLRQTGKGFSQIPDAEAVFKLVPLTRLHLRTDMRHMQTYSVPVALIIATAGFGTLIVVIAVINFINLMAAQLAGRRGEIVARKVAGARSRDLVLQFTGEALLYACLAMAVAMAIVEQCLPMLNRFIGRSGGFEGWRDGEAAVALAVLVLITGILGGLWPGVRAALRRPADILKGGRSSRSWARRGLIAMQLALMISLLIATCVVHSQIGFSLNEGIRLNKTGVLVVFAGQTDRRIAVDELPGVEATALSSWGALASEGGAPDMMIANGKAAPVVLNPVGSGFFELYGINPVAGRLLTDRDVTAVSGSPAEMRMALRAVIINMSAVRSLGLASPEGAVGKRVGLSGNRAFDPAAQALIVGVVPDVALDSVHQPVPPSAYHVPPFQPDVLSVRLGKDTAERTLRFIEALYSDADRPVRGFLLDDLYEANIAPIRKLAGVFSGITCLAALIAFAGVFQFAASIVRNKAREIAIRKALGARPFDGLWLLAREILPVVILANLMAWPVAWILTRKWLHGFADHVEMEAWMFAAGACLSLLVTLGALLSHALPLLHMKPATVLRSI